MNKVTSMSMLAAAAVIGNSSENFFSSQKGITKRSIKPSNHKQSRLAGMRSKAHQFPDVEKLPDGRNRWYKKHGQLVQRDV